MGNGVLELRPSGCFWGKKGEEGAIPMEEPKLVENPKCRLLSPCYGLIHGLSLRGSTLAGRPFHLLCVTYEELGPDGCCNTRKASGERVVEPGFESRSVFVSKT